MKKLFYLGFLASLFACNPKPIVNISGTILNEVENEIIVSSQLLDSKDTLKIVDGNFMGSLNVENPGMYALNNGKFGFRLYLKPGDELNIVFDVDQLKRETMLILKLQEKVLKKLSYC